MSEEELKADDIDTMAKWCEMSDVVEFSGLYRRNVPLLVARVRALEVSLAAALRAADRLRHGTTIEGDDVCPNEMRAEQAMVALRSAAEAQRFVMDPTELPAGPAVSEIRLRATVVGGHIDEALRALAGAATDGRAKKAEKLAAAERAYRIAEVAYTIAGNDESKTKGAANRWRAAEAAYLKAHAALIEAGGKP